MGPTMNQASVEDLTSSLTNFISQLRRTEEELQTTTIKVQLELLKERCIRLTNAIVDARRKLDSLCLTEDVKIVESKTREVTQDASIVLSPYKGGLVDGTEVQDFEWKNIPTLEKEKKSLLGRIIPEDLKREISSIYSSFEERVSELFPTVEKQK